MRREDVWADRAVRAAAGLTAAVALTVTLFLVISVLPLVRAGDLARVLVEDWSPRSAEPRHGIAPMIGGSLALAVTALALALPAAIGVCACAHGVAPRPLGRVAMVAVRAMTGVPTVVYGFASVFLVVPLVRDASGRGSGYSLAAAALTLAFLVLPTIVLVLESRLSAVDAEVPLTCAALGLAPVQTFTRVLLPLVRSGLASAAVLGFCRAMGDTLVALMVAGNAPQWPSSLLDSVRTLTAHVALVLATDAHGPEYRTVAAAGLVLFLLSAVGATLVRRRLSAEPPPRHANPG